MPGTKHTEFSSYAKIGFHLTCPEYYTGEIRLMFFIKHNINRKNVKAEHSA
jgi:hypothetical protein